MGRFFYRCRFLYNSSINLKSNCILHNNEPLYLVLTYKNQTPLVKMLGPYMFIIGTICSESPHALKRDKRGMALIEIRIYTLL